MDILLDCQFFLAFQCAHSDLDVDGPQLKGQQKADL